MLQPIDRDRGKWQESWVNQSFLGSVDRPIYVPTNPVDELRAIIDRGRSIETELYFEHGPRWTKKQRFGDWPAEVKDALALDAFTSLSSTIRHRNRGAYRGSEEAVEMLMHAKGILERVVGRRPSIELLRELYDHAFVLLDRRNSPYCYPNEALYSPEELVAVGVREAPKPPPRNGIFAADVKARKAAHRERLIARCREVGYVPTARAVRELELWQPYRIAMNALGGADAMNRMAHEIGLPLRGSAEIESLDPALQTAESDAFSIDCAITGGSRLKKV
jgi:hypothetical protein